METLSAPRGLIVELITPLTRGGTIDAGALGRLLSRVAPFVQGIFLASPRAGDGTALTPDLRGSLLRETMIALDQNPLPVFMWVTQADEDATRETMETLRDISEQHPYAAGRFWVDTPLYYHSNRGLPDLYRELCPLAGAPILLHNDPVLIKELGKPLKRSNIRTAILKELMAYSELSGMIFSGSLDRAHHYQRACRSRSDFRIYDGDEVQFLDYPSKSGVVSMGANLAPGAWERIVRSSLHLSAHTKDYPDHLQQIWETGRDLRRMQTLYAGAPAAVIKDALAYLGIIEPAVKPLDSSESLRDALRELLGRLG